jgi:hypothetical protein
MAVVALGFAARRVFRPRLTAKTSVNAVALGNARWTRSTDGQVERIELQDGTLSLRIHRAPNDKRVVLRVPDGEIEDRGTSFHVVVSQGHTMEVGVDEGSVTLRLVGAAPVSLSAGLTWERFEPRPSMGRPAAIRNPIAPSEMSSIAPQRARLAPPPALPASRDLPAPPPDAAAQDAAYLRAIELAREGRDRDAQAAAREYLRRFPDGFRRQEMGQIAR